VNAADAARDARLIDGVETYPKGDGHTWLYIPDRPRLERSDTGTALLQVIEAGPVAFLQATLRLALPHEERDRLLAVLQATDPAVTDLVPAPLTVDRLALEVLTGTWVTVAEGAGSGAAPWNAALGASLGPEATAAIKAAIDGRSGQARLVARFAVGGSPGSVHEATATAEALARTTEGAAYAAIQADLNASVEATEPTTREASADLSESFTTTGR
jgi:hypothetical protein